MDFIVKVKVIPNVFEKKNRIEKEVPYEPVSVYELFAEHCPDFTAGDFYPVVNGKKADWEKRVNPRDEVIFINDIQGNDGNLFSIVLGTAAIAVGLFNPAASWAVYAYAFGGSMLATGAIGALGLFTPSIPGNTLRNDYEDSRTYNWGGIENIVGEGNVVPVVYGRHRVGGAIISGFIDGDAESGKQTGQYLNYLIALSEGEIGGVDHESVKINDTMLTDYEDAQVSVDLPKDIGMSSTSYTTVFDGRSEMTDFKIKRLRVVIYVPDGLMGWDDLSGNLYHKMDVDVRRTYYRGLVSGSAAYTQTTLRGKGKQGAASFTVDIDLPTEDVWKIEIRLRRNIGSMSGVKVTKVSYVRKGGIYYLASRLGTAEQEPIVGFSSIRRDTAISGKKITYNNTQSFTTVDVCDAAVVSIAFPALYHLDDKGNIKNKAVQFRIDHRLYSDPDEPASWTTAADPEDGDTTFTCTGATRAEVVFSYRINFKPAGRRVIRITRLSADVSDGDTKNAADSYFSRVVEVQSANVAYNNTALLALRVRATDSISGSTPTVTAVVDGRLIRDVRNLAAEPLPSSNPANILYDLLTSTRYGAGRFLDAEQIDLESFQEFADFCDEIVYYTDGIYGIPQKRFELNLVIDKEFRLTEIIQKILGSCRAVGIWSGDKLRIAIDREAETTQIFCMGNIVEDSYSETYADYGSVPNQLEAQYLDEESGYDQQMVSIYDAERIAEPVNSSTIQLYGLTDKARVKRELAFALRKAKSRKKTLEFSAGFDAVVAEIGDIIAFQHDTPQYGSGGRIKEVHGNFVVLDIPVTIPAGKVFTFKVRRADGTIFESVHSAPITDLTLDVLGEISGHGIQPWDVWVIGFPESEAKPYRIISIEKGDDLTLKLVCEEYNASIYTDDVTSLVASDRYNRVQVQKQYELGPVGDVAEIGEVILSSQPVNITPPLVTDITIAEDFAVYTPKNPLSGVIVSFRHVEISGNPSVYVKEYELLYSEDAVNWRSAGVTKSSRFELGGLLVGRTYYFVVRSRTNYGVVNAPEFLYPHRTLYSIALGGEQNTFAAVQNLAAVRTPEGIRLSWRVSVSADVAHYHIDRARTSRPIQPPVLLVEQFNGTVFTDSSALVAGFYNYTVTPTDPWGNDGEAAGVSVFISAPAAPAGLVAVGDLFAVKLNWAAVADADYYEIWRADTVDGTKQLIGTSINNAYVDGSLGALDDYYYFVRTHDVYGFFSSFSSGVYGSTDADPEKLFDALAGDANPAEVRTGFADVVNLPEIKSKVTGVFAVEDGVLESGVVESSLSDIPPLHPRINEALIKLTQQGNTLIAQGTAILQNAEQIALRVAQTEYDGDMSVIADALSDITVEIGQIQTTVYDSEAGLVSRMQQTESQFMLAVADATTGKVITGLKVLGDPEQDLSEIAFMADKIKFVSPAEGNDKIALFDTAGGVLALNMDIVATGSITADKYLELVDHVYYHSLYKNLSTSYRPITFYMPDEMTELLSFVIQVQHKTYSWGVVGRMWLKEVTSDILGVDDFNFSSDPDSLMIYDRILSSSPDPEASYTWVIGDAENMGGNRYSLDVSLLNIQAGKHYTLGFYGYATTGQTGEIGLEITYEKTA